MGLLAAALVGLLVGALVGLLVGALVGCFGADVGALPDESEKDTVVEGTPPRRPELVPPVLPKSRRMEMLILGSRRHALWHEVAAAVCPLQALLGGDACVPDMNTAHASSSVSLTMPAALKDAVVAAWRSWSCVARKDTVSPAFTAAAKAAASAPGQLGPSQPAQAEQSSVLESG